MMNVYNKHMDKLFMCVVRLTWAVCLGLLCRVEESKKDGVK